MGLLAARQAENGRSSCELVAPAFSHRHDRLAGSRAGSHSQRTTRCGRWGMMGLHRGYIRAALAGLLLHARGVVAKRTSVERSFDEVGSLGGSAGDSSTEVVENVRTRSLNRLIPYLGQAAHSLQRVRWDRSSVTNLYERSVCFGQHPIFRH
jgi:hypothetical protein